MENTGKQQGKSSPKFFREENFFDRVYELVGQIPFGMVSTYGSIAKALGAASSSRMVGYALTCAAGTDIPCHRVVNRFGALTGRLHFGNPNLMRQLLEAEGITFRPDGTVDMEKHLYDFLKAKKLPR
ncbi:MAG: MGMT family protein [Chlorobiales bacterium]|nr:MGMT family protein [Chlorobiales bacterium]